MTLNLTSIANVNDVPSTEAHPEIDSVECVLQDFSSSNYEQGRWDGNKTVFIIDDTAQDVVPW